MSHMAHLKAQSIRSLYQNIPGVHETLRDQYYEVQCNAGTAMLTLKISLPPQFPSSPPTITVVPPVRHPWVNNEMQVVGCSQIRDWSMHSDLGTAVRDIMSQFTQYPPQLLPYGFGAGQPPAQPTYRPSFPTQPVHTTPQQHQPHMQYHQSQTLSQPQVEVPQMPETFPEVSALSFEELQRIHEDKDSLIAFIGGLSFMEQVTKLEREERKKTEDLARENLAREPELVEMRQRVAEKHTLLAEKQREFEDLLAQQEELSKSFAPETILDSLKIATRQAEEESDVIAHEFHEGRMPLEQFLHDFVEKKKLHHLRKAKEEQLARSIHRT